MQDVWQKLNLNKQQEIAVLNAPGSFEPQLKKLQTVRVKRRLTAAKEIHFVLAFVMNRAELDKLSAAIAAKAPGDALVWFAYPKGSSKSYTCDFNRDSGWDVLRASGFDTVRQVAIDEDWSALRFRRVEFINARRRA
jgi:hypothetical protein